MASASFDLSTSLSAGSNAVAAAGALPANLQGQYASVVSDQQVNGEANAVDAMGNILSKGSFDPNDPADDQAMLTITAGALTALGQPEIAGALLLLYAVAQPVMQELQNLGLITGCKPDPSKPANINPCCSHTGPATTTADILNGMGYPWPSSQVLGVTIPGHPPTAFARIALPILAKYAADADNCKNVPPRYVLTRALAALWNRAGSGAQTQVFVPAWCNQLGPIDPDPFATKDAAALMWAFAPANEVPADIVNPITTTFTGPTILGTGPQPSFIGLNSGPPVTTVAAARAMPAYTPLAPNLSAYALTTSDELAALNLASYALPSSAELAAYAVQPAKPSIAKPLAVAGAGLVGLWAAWRLLTPLVRHL